MPTIRFQKEELKAYLKKDVSDDKLEETISMIGTDLESFGEEIAVEVFPERPDLLSVPGMARAINYYLGFEKKRKYTAKKGQGVVKVLASAKNVRPYTTCAIVRNLKFTDEMIKQVIDIQEKLHITFGRNRRKMAIGIYPLEKITLPITFGAEDPKDIVFQPLEMDKEVNSAQMLKEHPTGEKYGYLLEGYKKHPVFRDGKKNVLSVPPIINSHDVGKISEDTTDVFIECSGHELLPQQYAINIIVCALADMGGTIESMTVEYGDKKITSPDLSDGKMNVDPTYVASRTGIPQKDIHKSLEKMGIDLDGHTAHFPAYRADFMHQVDVAEDAAIGYGYNNIERTVPTLQTTGAVTREHVVREKIREVLSGLGMLETMNYYITSDGVKLDNPLTQEYSSLRRNILDQLLDVLQKNLSNPYPQEVFEIGPVFSHDKKKETTVKETEHVSALICGEEADYTRIRQALETLAHAFGWNISFTEHTDEKFLEGRCAKVSGDVSGVIGEIHPLELEKRGVNMPAAGFEVNLK